MSFSLQLGSVHHFLTSEKLDARVYSVPVENDRLIAEEKLRAEGIDIDLDAGDQL